MRFNQAGEILCQNYHPKYLQNLASALGYGYYKVSKKKTGNTCKLVWLNRNGDFESSSGDGLMELPYDVQFYN